MSLRRIGIVVRKELSEFRANPSAILPVAILVFASVAIPVFVIVVIPTVTGRSISEDREIARIVALARERQPELQGLPDTVAVEAFMLQQFLLLFVLTPIVGAVSLAAYSVVGEKQGKSLEPLLTTPLTAAELLLGKVFASLLPALVMEAIGILIHLALMSVVTQPGVLPALLTFRSAVMLGLIGPLSALVALQLTIAVSSRVRDPRSAQQVAVLLVLPLVGMLIGQVIGAFMIPTWGLLAIAGGLGAVWVVLILFGVALFDRERILTEWK